MRSLVFSDMWSTCITYTMYVPPQKIDRRAQSIFFFTNCSYYKDYTYNTAVVSKFKEDDCTGLLRSAQYPAQLQSRRAHQSR